MKLQTDKDPNDELYGQAMIVAPKLVRAYGGRPALFRFMVAMAARVKEANGLKRSPVFLWRLKRLPSGPQESICWLIGPPARIKNAIENDGWRRCHPRAFRAGLKRLA